ncbi:MULTISPECIES: hypothetical protein [Paraburkholderia]|uniref:hypothetical protein n=1 Tax=Paraburkholderia TaxID=1822464 RepID=UPI00225AA43E|nr:MULTISPECIES: hypothetical protein [Paraburkholderia]MCX4163590.1 hypothetical protein [Paraburkholderia megapolitana]MDN7159085.1 hypothetical protein [Paraburkholderia sp. CHISQ3]MDQ6496132.1 hypothetical protein [Paraburkholderia megapolitana]
MVKLPDDSNTDIVLNLSLPRGTDLAIASSLKRFLEEFLTIVLAQPNWESRILGRADAIARAFSGLEAPSAPLIEERIRRQKTMREVFARGDWLTAEQINALQVTPPTNKAQPASDWKRRGRIFGVTFNGKEYFAGYQFDAMCQPLQVIRDVLEALGPVEDSWKIAAWFHFPNGWIADLRGREGRPVAPRDVLDHRDEVVGAAHRRLGGYVA